MVICGDDPWSDSTQVPADSRFLAEHVRMPMLEPSCPQEVKDWVAAAFDLSKAGNIYIGYMMTVAIADGGGSVEVRSNQFPALNTHQRRTLNYEEDIEKHLDQFVLLPPRSWQREVALTERFERVLSRARELKINRIENAPVNGQTAPTGFIASGVAYAYLVHALEEMGLSGQLPILKIGLSYPLDAVLVNQFAGQCDQIFVVEERRSFIERQVHEILATARQENQLQTPVWGKRFPYGLAGIPDTRGLHPSLLIDRLGRLFRAVDTPPRGVNYDRIDKELHQIEVANSADINIPNRTPTFCPGCPHRDSASALLELRKDLLDKDYMRKHYKLGPIDLVAHGDTGCYTMLMFEPTTALMHNYSGMGLGGGTGGGVDPFIDNKQLVFMGDSTFFHSGQIAISQSISSGQDITYIILDNKTTAMTGHQTHPGMEYDLTGNPQVALEIENVVRGMAPKESNSDLLIARLNPAERHSYRQMVEKAVLADGVKILIADKECGITYHRRQRREEIQTIKRKGYLPAKTHMNVVSEVCEYCLECTNQTGCPGLNVVDTDYGPKIQTDMSWCVNDGACHRIGACPAFEEVTVLRKQTPRMGDEHVDLEEIPLPTSQALMSDQPWRCYITGVGGMGVGVCNGILVTAGHLMGFDVQFLNKKGLAIRNGGVFSQMVFQPKDSAIVSTAVIPFGKADLLIGVDLLEATRAIDPKHPYQVASQEFTTAVVNTAKTPTILSLMGREDFQPSDLEDMLRNHTDPDSYFGFNVGDLCERVLDSKLYANIMMLGIAFQKGLLPLSLEVVEESIRRLIRHDTDRNLRAFNIGRKIVLRPDLFVVEPTHETESARKAFRRKINTLRTWKPGKSGKLLAKQFRVLIRQTNRATRGLKIDDQLMRDVVIRTYDCLIWGGMGYARRYCKRLEEVFQKDDPAMGYAMTRMVVRNLAKVMLIKDEYYVARLLTSPEKYKRDRRRYKVNPVHGDKIIYRHHNVAQFSLLGRTFNLSLTLRDWQHRLVSRLKFMRGFLFPHKQEKAFRDWYEHDLVAKIDWQGPKDYQRWTAIVGVPDKVTGFRQIRTPKMEAARKRAEQLLATDAELFELPPAPSERRNSSFVSLDKVKR